MSIEFRNRLVAGFFPEPKIAFVYADVTDAARELERAHLSGPAAAKALAECAVGAALLSSETTDPAEASALRLTLTNGPLGNVYVEAMGDGAVRGFTKTKLIENLDGLEEFDPALLYGTSAALQVQRSVPGRLISNGQIGISPVSVSGGLTAYALQSLQREQAYRVEARRGSDSYLSLACGYFVERMPDGDREVFERISATIRTPGALAPLDLSHGPEELAAQLGLLGGTFKEVHPLFFKCRCSQDRVLDSIASLPEEDRKALAAEDRPLNIICHMCGKEYTITL